MGLRINLVKKPSVVKNIADVLKIKNDGFFEGNGYVIKWAFDHLLKLFDAKDYDKKMEKWQMETFHLSP